MTLLRNTALTAILMCSLSSFAGFGIQAGALSPTSALDDNDNGLALGLDFSVKFAVVGLKVEAFYIDSSGKYADELGDLGDTFASAAIDIEGMVAADLMFYPLGTTFFLQAGLNYTVLDAGELQNINQEVIDNELGLDLGLGITLFDKLFLQAKLVYTPDAINGDAADALDMDENLTGFLVTAGWRF